ncbi:major latex protein 22-like [Papaver somniferum]|uniref:major latex protein 22-like n=1 Tax=Papaver somniferum TaxID=3469 RepID=UPI000E7060B1|nr:major latex protein 22-like [Papaver somniferum]
MAHHGISGLVGKLVTEIEVHCDADEYYKIFKHQDVPNAVPHLFTGWKVIKGDGICSGSVKVIDGKTFSATEESTHTDETRTVHHRIFEGDFMKDFKKFDSVIQVKPKPDGKGSIVSWSMVYEKRNEDVPAPSLIYLSCIKALWT